MAAVFADLAPKDLHAHLHYIAERLPGNARVELVLNDAALVIPIIKRGYARKATTVGLLIRSGSVGRQALNRIVESLRKESYGLWLRKSAKRKLVSQCMPYWSVNEASLPLHVVAALRLICRETNYDWPPRLALTYPTYEIDETLPGRLQLDPLWRAGRSVGRTIGRILKGR